MKKVILAFMFLCSVAFASEPQVTFQTTMGNITFKLFPQIAPKAVENFYTHAKNGFYDGIIFHRVIAGFMIQGGDPTGTGRGGESIWHKEFEDEFKPNVVFDRAGILAMANRGPNTNGSQFFITVRPVHQLNGGYTIFGEVTDGYDVVKNINTVQTDGRDKPIVDVKIIKAIVK